MYSFKIKAQDLTLRTRQLLVMYDIEVHKELEKIIGVIINL